MSEPKPVVEEVVERVVTQVTNTLLNFEAFGESADKESSSEAENFQNTVTAKPAAVTVDAVEAQPVDLDLGDNEGKNKEADVLLFADSLLSCLSRKKSESKGKFYVVWQNTGTERFCESDFKERRQLDKQESQKQATACIRGHRRKIFY